MKTLAKRLLRGFAAALPERAQAQILQQVGAAAILARVSDSARADLIEQVCESGILASVPKGTQVQMLEQLCESMGPWSILASLAPRCPLESVGVSGHYGIVQSAATDQVMLPIYAQTGFWARSTNDLLSSFFAGRSGRYIDVGANIGLTTIPVARNPLVRCLAIEPEPTNFANLSVNITQNCRHGNVETRRLAVYSHRTRLRLELARDNLGDHRLHLTETVGRMAEESRSTIEIEAAPLDEIVTETAGPLAVKIDVQGAEPFVFQGGLRTLAAADLIIVEWAPYWMARLGGRPEVVTDVLRENFADISIADGDFTAAAPPESVITGAERLLEMARRFADDPTRYVDVIARK
jgi:FkbM family methyltransferase